MDHDTLWLGLHKTGTTYLQKSLDLSAALLDEAGVGYVELEEFRVRWTRPLLHLDENRPVSPGTRPSGARRWLVFDENIPALVQNVVSEGGLYSNGAARARKVADHLQLHKPVVVLGIRGFSTMLPSLYTETLKSREYLSFDDYLTLPLSRMSWLPLIDNILIWFPKSKILVYRAEDIRGKEANLLSIVTGIRASDFTMLDKPERVGASHAAIASLSDLAAAGKTISRRDIDAAILAHPRTPTSESYNPWTEQENQQLQAAYRADVNTIRKRSLNPRSRVRFISAKKLARVR